MTAQLCVWIPDWPVAAAISAGIVRADQPVAISDGKRLSAVSALARSAGVRREMRRRDAVALCPQLVVIGDDLTRQARSFEAVMASIEQVVAFPVVIRPGLVLAPARGPVGHCGGSWQAVEAVGRAIVEGCGAEAAVGIAHGTLAAILAARKQTVVPPEHTSSWLANAPLSCLTAVATGGQMYRQLAALVERLHHFGLRTLAELLALPRSAIADRFGHIGLLAADLAAGREVLLPQHERATSQVSVTHECDPPLSCTQSAAFLARALAEQLLARLAGRLATHLEVTCRTTEGTRYQRCWSITGASGIQALSRSAITDRVRWQLDAWLSQRHHRPDGQIVSVELCANGVGASYGAGQALWGQSDAHQRARRATERLQALVGPDRVLQAHLRGGRHPRERVILQPVTAPQRVDPHLKDTWPGQLPGPAPTRLYERPIALRLYCQQGNDIAVPAIETAWIPTPVHYQLATHQTGEREGIQAWAGPWPLVQRWWHRDGSARIYLQLIPHRGNPMLVASRKHGWVVEGIYD
ncbi:MAG: DNA polymerase Y family protein [Bowdeniella nasicola]|nr:DNA polymerase Y family protein [Bowdeniella nasicola]